MFDELRQVRGKVIRKTWGGGRILGGNILSGSGSGSLCQLLSDR